MVLGIDLSRDNLLPEVSRVTLSEIYQLPEEKSPQQSFMRAAKAVADDEAHAQRLYDYASKLWFGFSTPILSNADTKKGQLISCFLNYVPDSIDGLSDHYQENIYLSTGGGGIGSCWSDVRPIGSLTSKGSASTGIIPHLHMVDAQMLAFMQGSSRRGKVSFNLDVSHPEIEEFITTTSKKPGDPARKAMHSFNCVSITDAFMEAVSNEADWPLIDPKDGKVVRTVPAHDLWEKILISRMQEGIPYIHYVDTTNRALPESQKNLGLKVRQTNLCCVTGDQIVNTEFGMISALELYKLNQPVRVFNGNELVPASNMQLIAKDQNILEIQTKQGYTHRVTENHRVMVKDIGWVEAKDLCKGDKVLIQSKLGVFGTFHDPDIALLNGIYHSDGTQTEDQIFIDLYSSKTLQFEEEVQAAVDAVYEKYDLNISAKSCRDYYETPKFRESAVAQGNYTKKRLSSTHLKELLEQKGRIPKFVWEGDIQTVSNYLRGLYLGDGTFQSSKGISCVSYASIDKKFLQEIQILLSSLGIRSSICILRSSGSNILPDGKGGQKYYKTQDCYRLLITNYPDVKLFEDLTGFICSRGAKLEDREVYSKKDYAIITDVVPVDKEDVYCLEVFTNSHAWVANGFVTHNSEITLPTDENRTAICTLSSVNLAKYDEWKDDPLFVEDLIRMLDNATEHFINNAPRKLTKAIFSAKQERSLGLGAMGWHSYLQSKMIPFESPLAISATNSIFKNLQERAKIASLKLAKERGPCPDSIGMLERPRNMHLLAIAPNATSSIICGNVSPSIEPLYSNYYNQKTQNGLFENKNPYLLDYLESIGQNNDTVWKSIENNGGSVQHLDFLPENVKKVFKTAFEIDQSAIIRQASHRQKFLCQSQSLNLFLKPDEDFEYIHNIHYYAWLLGVKTLYYVRSKAPKKSDNLSKKIDRQVRVEHKLEVPVGEVGYKSEHDGPEEDTCLSCSG